MKRTILVLGALISFSPIGLKILVGQVLPPTDATLVGSGNIVLWVRSDGRMAMSSTGKPGLILPRDYSARPTSVFGDAVIWGGNIMDGVEPSIRVGGQHFQSGTVPGAILRPAFPLGKIAFGVSDATLLQ